MCIFLLCFKERKIPGYDLIPKKLICSPQIQIEVTKMKGFASEKIKGGKLVRINVEYADRIENVRITGDFFMHPEETLFEIEEALKGVDSKESEATLAERIVRIAAKRKAQLIGIAPEDIARVLRAAIS